MERVVNVGTVFIEVVMVLVIDSTNIELENSSTTNDQVASSDGGFFTSVTVMLDVASCPTPIAATLFKGITTPPLTLHTYYVPLTKHLVPLCTRTELGKAILTQRLMGSSLLFWILNQYEVMAMVVVSAGVTTTFTMDDPIS